MSPEPSRASSSPRARRTRRTSRLRAEHGSHPRPDLGHSVRRTRDAPQGRRRGRGRCGLAHAVRGGAPDLRPRARGRDQRRGGERASEDAGGAAVYVVLLLLTTRPTQVLPTIASRCQAVRFDPPTTDPARQTARGQGVPADTAEAAARLSLGDGKKAIRARDRRRPEAPAGAEEFARAPINGRSREAVGRLLARAKHARPERRVRGERSSSRRNSVSAEEGAQAPGRSSRSARGARIAAPPRRRSTTRCSSSASGTATSPCSRRAPLSSCSTPTGSARSTRTRAGQPATSPGARRRHARPPDSERLRGAGLEALAYRLEEALSSSSSRA